MDTKNMVNTFFHPEDHDSFARSQGYADMEQMCYYEDREIEAVQAELVEGADMTDRELETFVEVEESIAAGQAQYIAPPPVELMQVEYMPPPPAVIYVHELDKVDSREVYTDSEDCPHDGDFEALTDWQDLAGVY